MLTIKNGLTLGMFESTHIHFLQMICHLKYLPWCVDNQTVFLINRTTSTCTSAFLESFQKLADMAVGTRGNYTIFLI